MTSSALIRIGTHDGAFHTDDVLAVAILSTIFTNHQIVRTRDRDILEMMDILVDVGDEYDHGARRYDHHMSNPPTDNIGHIYSSAGLIWRHYSRAYLNAIGIPARFEFKDKTFDLLDAIENNIKTFWMYPIDRADNGVSQGPTPISEVVRALRPTDPEKSKGRYDTMFLEAVSMVSFIFKRSCFHSADHVVAKVKCTNEPKQYHHDNKIMVSVYPMYNYKTLGITDTHFVISPCVDYANDEPYFVIRPIHHVEARQYKTPFPHRAMGTRRESIEATLGVKGIRYIHHSGFLALADSESEAVAFCEQLLNGSVHS